MDDIKPDYGSDDFSESDSNKQQQILFFASFISIQILFLGEPRSHDENISFIPHLRQLEMATSLPVDVPKFIVNRSNGGLCDLDEQIRVT